MSTLDEPQHVYVCRRHLDVPLCVMGPCACGGPTVEPTLTYTDCESYLSTWPHPQPDALAVWDILERQVTTHDSNRGAIHAAVLEWLGERERELVRN